MSDEAPEPKAGDAPAQAPEPSTPNSPVMQPEREHQDGDPEPGLSPAFKDAGDLITEGPHSAPIQDKADDKTPPPPANHFGQPQADMMPTDEARLHYTDGAENYEICPVCQHRFKPGSELL
jgi:hypothetical protein